MKSFTESKNLPFILKIIKMRKLEGVLTCHFELGYPLELSFLAGELVYVHQEEAAHTSHKLLDYMLKWVTFNVDWRNEALKLSNPNVSKSVRDSFQEAIEGLMQEGSFLAPELTRLDPAFFGKLPPVPVASVRPPIHTTEVEPIRIELTPPGTPQTEAINKTDSPNQKPKPRYTIETNLLLPPGPRQEQLEELLKAVNFNAQIEMLGHSRFTGCIYYRLGNNATSRTQYGLVLLIEGKPCDVVYHPGSELSTQKGQDAFQALGNLDLTPEIYKVEIRTLKAYRGLVSPEETTQVYEASNANFAKIIQAFKQSGRDGVVLLYFNSLKLHYFLMFENGLQVGIFSTDANSGRLQPLSAPLALPTNGKEATMTMQLVAKPSEMTAPTIPVVNKPQLIQPLIIPPISQPDSSEVESDGVDWKGMLIDLNARLEKPHEQSSGKPFTRRFEDDANPYEF